MANLVIGCGYLGEPVALEWLGQRRKRQVFATTRSERHRREMINLELTPVVCDVTQPETLKALPKADTVLYAIGLDRAAGKSMREVYVDGLAAVLDHLPPPKRFIYVSSSSVYGQQDGSWVDEGCATEPHEESGKIVLEAEKLLRGRIPEAIILRFAGIYGPDRLLRQQAIEAGEPLAGDPEKWLNLIHLFDGVEAVMAAEKRGVPGKTYNVSDGNPCTRRQFFTELARQLKAPEPRFVPLESGARSSHDSGHRRISNERLRTVLGVYPRYPSYAEGLAATIRLMRESEAGA